MPPAYSGQQKQLIQRFRDLTHEKDSIAARFLKGSGWKYDAAVDAIIMDAQYPPGGREDVADSTSKPLTEEESTKSGTNLAAVVIPTDAVLEDRGFRRPRELLTEGQNDSGKSQPSHRNHDSGYNSRPNSPNQIHRGKNSGCLMREDISESYQLSKTNNSVDSRTWAKLRELNTTLGEIAKQAEILTSAVNGGDSRLGASLYPLKPQGRADDLPDEPAPIDGAIQSHRDSNNQQTTSYCELRLTQGNLNERSSHSLDFALNDHDDELNETRLRMSEKAKLENPKLKQRLLDVYRDGALSHALRDKARGKYVFLLRRPGLTDEHLSAILRSYGMRPGLALGHGLWDSFSTEEAGRLAGNPIHQISLWARVDKAGIDSAVKAQLDLTVEEIQKGIHTWWEAPAIFRSLLNIEKSSLEQMFGALENYGINSESWLGLGAKESDKKAQIERLLKIIRQLDIPWQDESPACATECDENVFFCIDLLQTLDSLMSSGNGGLEEIYACSKRCFGDSTMSNKDVLVRLAEYDIFPWQWDTIHTMDAHRLDSPGHTDSSDSTIINDPHDTVYNIWHCVERIEMGLLDTANGCVLFKELLGNPVMSDAEMHRGLTVHRIQSRQLLDPSIGSLGKRLRVMYDAFRSGSIDRVEATALCRDLFKDSGFELEDLSDALVDQDLPSNIVPPHLYKNVEKGMRDTYNLVERQLLTHEEACTSFVETFKWWRLDPADIVTYLEYLEIPTDWIAPYMSKYVETGKVSPESNLSDSKASDLEERTKLPDSQKDSGFSAEVYSQLSDIYNSTLSKFTEVHEAIPLFKAVLGSLEMDDKLVAQSLNAHGIPASGFFPGWVELDHKGTIKKPTLTQPRPIGQDKQSTHSLAVSSRSSSLKPMCSGGRVLSSALRTSPPIPPLFEVSGSLNSSSNQACEHDISEENIHILHRCGKRRADVEPQVSFAIQSSADRGHCKRFASNPDPNNQNRKQQKRDSSSSTSSKRVRFAHETHGDWNATLRSDQERASETNGSGLYHGLPFAAASHMVDEMDGAQIPEPFDLLGDTSDVATNPKIDEIDEAQIPEPFDLLGDTSDDIKNPKIVDASSAVFKSAPDPSDRAVGTSRTDSDKETSIHTYSPLSSGQAACSVFFCSEPDTTLSVLSCSGPDSAVKAQRIEAYVCDNNRYFGNQQPVSSTPQPSATLQKLFNAYCDSPKENPDLIGIEGAMKYLQALEINLDEVSVLVISEALQSPTMGEFTREGYLAGWQRLAVGHPRGAGSLANQSVIIGKLCSNLPNDDELFKRVYKHTFLIARNPGQKAILLDTATEYWRLLFTHPSKTWNTTTTPWLDWYIEFLETKWKKGVNKDMWIMTLSFYFKTKEDEKFSWWSEDGAWPSVLDDFVKFVKEKRGDGGNAEDMEIE